MISVQESRQRNQLQPAEYEDALTAVAALVERSQRVTQKILKRSLGNRAWSRNEISAEIKRIAADLDTYLHAHVVKMLDIMHSTNTQTLATLSTSVEDIMVKLAEMDIRLRTPNPADGPAWSPMILSQAENNTSGPSSDLSTMFNEMMKSESKPTEALAPSLNIGRSLASSARVSIKVSGLKTLDGPILEYPVTIPNVSVGAAYPEVLDAIRLAGYIVPTDLIGEAMMLTTGDVDDFDATSSGGLKISMNTPILTWWCKYREYHGIAPRTTPRHTIAERVESDADGYATAIQAGGVKIRFHRTLRVPDNPGPNWLPLDLGRFPLVPVARFANRLPENIKSRGGFLMPMFEREALFIAFRVLKSKNIPAVKVSAGGVNVLTGIFKNVHDAQLREQDYIVPGHQQWIDGTMTGEGVVRQFVAMPLGKNYTIEEQITGKAEEGGFQFDIFPRRPAPDHGDFYEFNMTFGTHKLRATNGRTLEMWKTPAECGVSRGGIVGFFDHRHWPVRSEHNWTVGAYQRRIGDFPLVATYERRYVGVGPSVLHGLPQEQKNESFEAHSSSNLVTPMGIGLGGKISQKIYKDTFSPRMYDEENGHRFHVHIISADMWETVTGVLLPITPITRDTYKRQNLPWFTLSDSNFVALAPTTDVLGNLKSVVDVDREEAIAQRSHAKDTAEALIDPNRPPNCSIHMKVLAEVVFRPCGHTACSGCLGKAMLKRSRCLLCSQEIAKFVGMKEPVAGFDEVEANDAAEEGLEPSWNIKLADIQQGEALAAQAIQQGKVVVIHLEKDGVAPLHSYNTS